MLYSLARWEVGAEGSLEVAGQVGQEGEKVNGNRVPFEARWDGGGGRSHTRKTG